MHQTLISAASLPLIPLLALLSALMFVESDAVIVFVGILIHLGIVPLFWGVAISLVFGFLNDLVWFGVGRKMHNKDHSMIAWIQKVTARANVHLTNHTFKAIFLTKFMYGIVGIHRATLIRCGMNHLSFKKFFVYNGVSVIVWAVALIAFGYFASDSVTRVNHVVRIIELSFISLVIVFVALRKIKKAWITGL